MPVRLFERVLWQKTTHYRKSDFRVVEQSESRIVLRTSNYGLLLGGIFFLSMGIGTAWLGFSEVADETPALVMCLVFAGLCAALGAALAWAARAQRDSIVVDRSLGTVRSARAKKRKRAGEDLFTIKERPLSDLADVELWVGSGSASLSLKFRSFDPIAVDHATDIEHLRTLGLHLAAVAGVELRQC